jgi:hypothetical protein
MTRRRPFQPQPTIRQDDGDLLAYTIYYQNGHLAYVIFSPRDNGVGRFMPGEAEGNQVELDYLDSIAAQMRRVIIDAYRNNDIVNINVIGNQEGALHGNYNNSHTVYHIMKVSELTGEAILGVFESDQNSGDTIFFDQYEWKWVFWPSPRTGGCASFDERPSFARAANCKFLDTWEPQGVNEENPDGVNCAAYAIARWIRYLTVVRETATTSFCKRSVISLAYEIQKACEWKKFINVMQLKVFVEIWKDYRIILLEEDSFGIGVPFIGVDYKYTEETNSQNKRIDKTIYLYYDYNNKGHYAAVKDYVRQQKKIRQLGKTHSYCRICCLPYHIRNTHVCGEEDQKKPVNLNMEIKCRYCAIKYPRFDEDGKDSVHECAYFKCSKCSQICSRDWDFIHRCPLYKVPDKHDKVFCRTSCRQFSGADVEKSEDVTTSLWAYDIESRMVEALRGPPGKQRTVKEHVANLLVAKNVYSGEQKIWRGDDCLFECIRYMLKYNNGNNIMVAHNGARYDTQLIYEECTKFEKKDFKNELVSRGVKILSLKIWKKGSSSVLRFHDSLLQLQGSLASLASSFCAEETGDTISKGYFPHKFNTLENWEFNYIGPLPDKSMYGMPQSCKTKAELDKFEAWYEEAKLEFNDPMHPCGGTWNFKEQLELYCVNDVRILAIIMDKYAQAMMVTFDENPWFSLTAPSYVHKEILKKITFENGITRELVWDQKRKAEKKEVLNNLLDKTWVHLFENEYFFARRALRGGRTEAKCLYRKLTQEEIHDGKMIRYLYI